MKCADMSTCRVHSVTFFHLCVFAVIINLTDSVTSVTALSTIKHKTRYSYNNSKVLTHAIRIE